MSSDTLGCLIEMQGAIKEIIKKLEKESIIYLDKIVKSSYDISYLDPIKLQQNKYIKRDSYQFLFKGTTFSDKP